MSAPISTIFFDMDGVLIHSEPFWQIAEAEVFHREFGIALSSKDTTASTGLKTTEVVALHAQTYNLGNLSLEHYGHLIEKKVIEQVFEKGEAMTGLYDLVDFIKEKEMGRFLVTSSSHYVLENILAFLKLEDFFEACFSAYDEEWGKPNPAVYLSAMSYAQVPIETILVIEDSFNGVKAARAAGLNVWSLPETHNRQHPFFTTECEFVCNNHFEIKQKLETLYLD
jgi:sugar-phosphatase